MVQIISLVQKGDLVYVVTVHRFILSFFFLKLNVFAKNNANIKCKNGKFKVNPKPNCLRGLVDFFVAVHSNSYIFLLHIHTLQYLLLDILIFTEWI